MTQKPLFILSFICCLCLSTSGIAQLSKYGKKFERSDAKTSYEQQKPATRSTAGTNTPVAVTGDTEETLIVEGEDYYVSANRGGGRLGTKDQPARDLASILSLLEPGDRVHIAEGIYTSKLGRSSDLITVPVSIIGGYNDDFTKRDPWGEHLTILSGVNEYNRSETGQRLGISIYSDFPDWKGMMIIDGLIIDNGARNHYADEDELQLIRPASPVAEKNPSPDSPGLYISTGANTQVTIRNCILMNCAASQGALDIRIGKFGRAIIENNLLINNTGDAIYCRTKHIVEVNQPHFIIRNNSILFTWKYDPLASRGGTCISADRTVSLELHSNLMGFADYGALNNSRLIPDILLQDNFCFSNKEYDYKEGNTNMRLADMEDFAEYINPQSSGNRTGLIHLPLDEDWAWAYLSRAEPSREAIDNKALVYDTEENQLRAALGLPLQAVAVDPGESVWLPRLSLETALKVGEQRYNEVGCRKPQ